MLLAQPINLVQPFTHLPWWSLIRPPPLASLGHPRADPSKFSLNQFCVGNSHLTIISIFGLAVSWLDTKQENSDARNSTSLIKEWFIWRFWKLHLFLWSHKFRILKRKNEFHRKGLLGMGVSLQELTFNQVERGEVKNSVSEPSIPTPIQ